MFFFPRTNNFKKWNPLFCCVNLFFFSLSASSTVCDCDPLTMHLQTEKGACWGSGVPFYHSSHLSCWGCTNWKSVVMTLACLRPQAVASPGGKMSVCCSVAGFLLENPFYTFRMTCIKWKKQMGGTLKEKNLFFMCCQNVFVGFNFPSILWSLAKIQSVRLLSASPGPPAMSLT